ncbi:MAG: lipopolysaccharide heptosyltransferase II [Lentisphaeraceae bacterium]|nr:lipopolysaccharide heptosyltransferase II [Lentisphaeraceae bacterium]
MSEKRGVLMDFYTAEIGTEEGKTLLPGNVNWKAGVLLRSTNWLGDACMTLPAVYKIRQQMPQNCKLFILAPKNLKSFWETFPWVDEVIGMASKRVSKDEKKLIENLNAGVAVVLPNSFGSALDIAFKSIPVRLGRGGRWRTALLTHRLPGWKRVAGEDRHHQLREYLQLARACGELTWDDSYPPAEPQVSAERLKEIKFDASKKWLCLAPGAKFGPAKQWPISHYAAVAKDWLAKGGEVVVIGTPDEVEVSRQVVEEAGGGLDLAGKTNLQELMYILGNVTSSVVNDSGAMHLSAAMGGQGVAVFGSTDPLATGPLGGKWKVIWNKIDCSPCLKKVCESPGRDYDCLKGVTPQQVIKALGELEE